MFIMKDGWNINSYTNINMMCWIHALNLARFLALLDRIFSDLYKQMIDFI
jgi:hypothetical protein